ncbi:MAG: cellulose synthase subunit BcsC [Pedosphaera sp.]|nr:cellulose synthase subunit BcsC [Pedosphaera sp.]
MPSTVNGIGTHYYGKRNLHTRPGVCSSCRRAVNLSSYDTRLWFVIVFIPIIPLGRKRITDDCPACRRHYVANWQKWETAKQLEISGALEKYRSDPSPENALEAHRILMVYRQTAAMADFQKLITEKFADNARVQAQLGVALTAFGQPAESEPFFARAYALRPDMPEARIGVAEGHIRAGRLVEARQLLDFLEKPGAGQLYSLGSLERLAFAYQANHQHTEALALFGRLVEEIPAVAQHSGFRKAVQKSEKALGAKQSVLPKTKFSLRRLFQRPAAGQPASFSFFTLLIILGVIGVLVAAGLAIGNEYIRRHRTLFVVNALSGKLQLNLPGRDPYNLTPGVNEIKLPEGHYHATFQGATQESVDFDIRATYFNRWFDHPAWALNPGGAAILVRVRAVYSENPQPPGYDYFFGQSFQAFPAITHPFTDLPETVSLESSGETRTLTGLALFQGEPLELFYELESKRQHAEALRLAEWRLARHPDDTKILIAYQRQALTFVDEPRLEAFLRSGLTNRPINIEWHRAYQDQMRSHTNHQQLADDYNQLLQNDPENSTLLYLKGRICDDPVRSAEFFERARRADTNNPYPLYAIAANFSNHGDWQSAKPLLDRAVELLPTNQDFCEQWKLVCFALGEFQAPETVFRKRLGQDPFDLSSVNSLCEILSAQGKRSEADQFMTNLGQSLRARYPNSKGVAPAAIQEHYLYALGDFTALEKTARLDKSASGKIALFYALLEQNHLDEAARIFSTTNISDPATLLGVSLAFRLAGRNSEAAQWQAPVIEDFRVSGADCVRAADLLNGTTPPAVAALNNLDLSPSLKAVLLANLAVLHPDVRDQINAAARRLNAGRVFPYHLIQRATAPAP